MGHPLPSERVRRRTLGAERPPSSGASDALSPVRTIAARLLDGWEDIGSGWMATRAEATQAVSAIVSGIEQILDPSLERPAATEVGTRPLLIHRLAEALRIELVRGWDPTCEDAEAARLLEVLSALDRYRRELWPDPHEDLLARLAEPDAFELVVELAHDVRSPLNSILFLSEVLRSGHSGPVNDHQRSQLGLIYSATLGMISVVSDVMELASERRGAEDDEPSPFSLSKVFESVREMVRPMAEEKGLDLEFSLPDYDRFVGHPNRLGRVLLNLTTNALKFTEEGCVTVSATRSDRASIEFSVRDTGRGIAEEDLDELFQPFRKSAYRMGYFFSGSGLGLSIAQRLVRAMGSELRVETELGQGTRFFFALELPAPSRI